MGVDESRLVSESEIVSLRFTILEPVIIRVVTIFSWLSVCFLCGSMNPSQANEGKVATMHPGNFNSMISKESMLKST